MPGPLVLVEPGQRRPRRRAGHRERPRTVAVRDPVVPVELCPAAGERRHQPGQLGVHRPAVVALVVVLEQHLVVGRDLVAQHLPGDQVPDAVVVKCPLRVRHLSGQRPCLGRREVHEDEALPGLDADRVQREGVRVVDGRRAAPAAATRPGRRSRSGRGSAANPRPAPAAPAGTAGSRGAGRRCTPRAGRRRVAGHQHRLAGHVDRDHPLRDREPEVVEAADAVPLAVQHGLALDRPLSGVDVHLAGEGSLQLVSHSTSLTDPRVSKRMSRHDSRCRR